jgi:hypothetical protein
MKQLTTRDVSESMELTESEAVGPGSRQIEQTPQFASFATQYLLYCSSQ